MYKTADNVALMLNVNAGRPLQAQLFEQVRAMIIDGQLTSGTPLPATRALSEQLGVSRNTVVLAYDRLLSEGYIESKRSIGTFVSDAIPDTGLKPPTPPSDDANNVEKSTAAEQLQLTPEFEQAETASSTENQTSLKETNAEKLTHKTSQITADVSNDFKDFPSKLPPPSINFKPGLPDIEAFPTRTWRRLLNRNLNRHEDLYAEALDPLGVFELRRAIAEHLGPARGIVAEAQDVVIFSSAQEARGLLAQLLLRENAPAIMETPGPENAGSLFSYYKTDVYGIPVDDEGMLTSQLPEFEDGTLEPLNLESFDVPSSNQAFPHLSSGPHTFSWPHTSYGMAYVTPSHQFPLGASLALSRRVQLLEWAQRTGIMVVEDESTSDFRYGGSPLTALKGLDNRIVSNDGALEQKAPSKDGCVVYLGGFKKSLGIDIGYLVVPSFLIPAVRQLKSLGFGTASLIEQAALAEFIDNGAYDRHLRKLRKKCKEKRDLLISLLTKHFGEDISLSAIEGGLHLIWHLPNDFGTANDLSKDMLHTYKIGLYGVQTGGSMVVQGKKFDKQALVFGYASLSLEEIETGVDQLVTQLKYR